MTEVRIEDLRATHGVLLSLYSETQGWFVWENVLIQLEHPSASSDALEEVKASLHAISELTDLLRRDEPIVLADGTVALPDAASQAAQALVRLADEMEAVAELHSDAMMSGEQPPNQAGAVLSGSFAWLAYAHEHSVKGAMAFAKSVGDSEGADYALQLLPMAQQTIRSVAACVEAARKGLDEPGVDELRREVGHAGGVLSARSDELRARAAKLRPS